MVNLANDRWRRLVRRRESSLTYDRADETDPYQRTEQRDLLVRTLHTLPIGMRTVLVLRYFDDMADGEIAGFMGISAATVRSQASRGMARLRAELNAGRGEAPQTSLRGDAA
jgi:RNA polymerase sigma factor (sigma-70 family)